MAAPAQTSAFPSPYAIATPQGCEGWEEMYPYYARFDEARRETDEGRFWFWNSMHFPVPMPAFDVACIDAPYQAVGAWQNRVFAVPPAMGLDYRIVNGYVYISGNPVTDPAKVAERAEFFQRRAGHHFEHWAEPYGRWTAEIDAELAGGEAGRRWLAELEKIKDPWFNMAVGDGLYHFYGSWYDDPTIPYASVTGHVRALEAGELVERPSEEIQRERDRLAE